MNLSFDQSLSEKMVKAGVVPKLVALLHSDPVLRDVCIKLLYHFSMDDRNKTLFSYTDIVPTVTDLIINYPEPELDKALIALGVNLAANVRNVERIVDIPSAPQQLVKRFLVTYDVLLAKMIRNMTQHEAPFRSLFIEFIPPFAEIVTQTDSQDLLVEVLGMLGNLTIDGLSYSRLLIEYDLVPVLVRILMPGFAEDDVALEVVIFIGSLELQNNC